MQPEPAVGKVTAIALDLDGTLVDSAPDLAAAANNTLQAMGLGRLAEAQVRAMIGDGLDVLLQRCLQATLEREPELDELSLGREMMRGFYGEEVFRRGRVYPGVQVALERWQRHGLLLACVTNKASKFTRPLLRDAGLDCYFSAPYCADEPGQRKPSPTLLLQFMREHAVEPSGCVMIGDSVHDMMAAHAAGVRAVAVTYGYGKPQAAGRSPWRTADRLDELALQ